MKEDKKIFKGWFKRNVYYLIAMLIALLLIVSAVVSAMNVNVHGDKELHTVYLGGAGMIIYFALVIKLLNKK